MSLQDVSIKNEYRSLIDNVVQDFYIPLLERAKVYKRAVGFFSSSSLVEITKGIAAMAANGGKIQIVASPYLSEEDIEAIQKGYAERNSVIEGAVLRQITGEKVDYYSMQRLNLLACLIAKGVLDIRIAYTEDKNGIGMYHEKMGLIEDEEGNVVAFSGSMNESATAMSINYETIDVFRSWGDQNEADRVRLKQNIMDCADEHSLPIQDFDWLTNSITTRGVLVYSEVPANVSSSTDDEYDDFVQSDYEGVYARIVKLSPSLAPFVAFVKNVMPPQRGEIKQLKYQIVDGNTYARDRMIEMHLRLALRVALQRAETYDMDIEDAVGYACTGLVTAVDRYDPDTSGVFASYAALWILQIISREQSTQRPLVYYPFHKKEDYFTMYPLLKAHGCIGCDELRSCGDALHMVCDKVGCAEDDAQKILLQMIPDERIEDLLELYSDENQEYYPKDITAGTILSNLSTETVVSDEDVYLSVQYKMLQEEIRDVLSTLTPREEKVLLLRYGFDGRERTLEEVGAEFNITRERIRQIEVKALKKLKHPSRSKHLKAYL